MARLSHNNFKSRIGIILATAGSAVGLGNIWRFPYMTGENGGAAFILLYILFILLLGIPGMICEFIVGRHAGTNAVRAYGRLSGKKGWRVVGYMGILSSILIFGFYSVVAGWCLYYLLSSVLNRLAGDSQFILDYFSTFSSDLITPILCGLLFIVLTHLVVAKGVRGGIERVSKLLMPLLFILLLVIVVSSCMLPGAERGIEFLFKPDFSKVTHETLLDALGQAFFSLSLGTACLCTYASYFSRGINLAKSAAQIALIDTLIAILAGLMIFPAAFSVGIDADSGPSLIFITLPNVFNQAFVHIPWAGYLISILFYALLALAALTSTISMHEIGTSFFQEEMRLPRKKAVWIVSGASGVICILSSMSMGAVEGMTLFGMPLLSFFDFITAKLMMPIGALLTTFYVGWYASLTTVRNEFTNKGTVSEKLFPLFLFTVRYICPIFILLIFMHELGLF
ncbi:MAG: sodium-dependent transporter [Prevotella sp.]|nr:sodium-dependent transporter [Prevotella sp.]